MKAEMLCARILTLTIIFCAASQAATPTSGTDRVILPDNVVPQHYDLRVTPDTQHLTFTGDVRITVQVKKPTRAIVLNAADLIFDKVSLAGSSATPGVTLQQKTETVTLNLPTPIAPGTHTLSIEYHGKIFHEATALFALDYDSERGVKQRALFTQFENSDARRFVPCWDEPGVKSTFSLTATVPQGQMAVSNMPVESAENLSNGTTRVRFKRSPKMSVYLLFFATGDFERIHQQVDNVDVGIVVKRGDAARAQFALRSAAQLLPYFNEYFGTPYPLPKLDVIGGPGSSQFFSAMENWGSIFHFERALLVDPRVSTQTDRQNIYTTLAHEISHMWFGDLVTMSWWDDLWLNEGFASWMENKSTDHFHPEWHIWLQQADSLQDAMQIDAALGTHPIITPIHDVFEANNAFDDITYEKGAAVIRMLEAYVGEDAFRAGVRNYMKAYAYGNTVTDDFWRHIDAASSRKITGIAHDFTLQAGVPLISLQSMQCAGGKQTLALTQERFAVDASGKSGAQNWRVPVVTKTLRHKAGASGIVSGRSVTHVMAPECGPVVVNAGQTGYFRTMEAAPAFAALLKNLSDVPATDQLGLLADSYALAVIGKAPMAEVLNLVDGLPVTADPLVWRRAVRRLGSLDRYSDGRPGQPQFRAYVMARLRPLMAALGWDPKTGESDNTVSLRENLLQTLGRVQDESVVAEARRRFAQWRSNPTAALPASLRDSMLTVVARNADEETWQQIHTLALNAATALEKENLYNYLGEAAQFAVAQKALALALSDEAPMTIRAHLIRAVADQFPREATEFTIAHWDQIAPLLGPSGVLHFVATVAESSSDVNLIASVDAFRKAYVPANAAGDFNKATARIRYNAMVTSRLVEVDRWIEERHAATQQ